MPKAILLLVFLTAAFFRSGAQEIEWQNTIGGSSGDGLSIVQQTADGGYIIGGSSNSNISGDKTENSNGNSDYWIVKTDSLGSILWQNTIGGSGIDILNAVTQTTDGGYILGGYSDSNISGDKTENSMGFSDYWVVKINSAGSILWQNTIGGSSGDWLSCIQQTADGGYILGGFSRSDISGDKTENSNGIEDYWIVKIDLAGNIQWQNAIGGNNEDVLFSIQQTTDEGYILGGRSKSIISGDKTETGSSASGFDDYWIVKTDSVGIIQWENTIGGNLIDQLYSIQQTADGGYILGGWSSSDISGDKTENSIGAFDCWIVKTNSAGNIQWQNTIGGIFGDGVYYIQQTVDGGYILGGHSDSKISGDKTENFIGNIDYWIVKTDSAGIIQWQNTIGGNHDDILFSIQQTVDGGYILGGNSWSNVSGDKTKNNWDPSGNSADYWIVKIADKHNFITGKKFIDINSNNMQDAAEPSLANNRISEINSGRFGFSDLSGNYSVAVWDSGSFTLLPASIAYFSAMPATHSAYFTGIQQEDSLNDFAFQPAGVFNDLCIAITPLGAFRAGFNAYYHISYENVGSTTLSSMVIFFPDDDVTFVSSSIAPTSVTTDSVVWSLGLLAPFQSGNIAVTINVSAGTPIGKLINSGVLIEPLAGDANPSCNISFREVFTTGSFDPNDIIVDEDSLSTTQFPNPPYLDYIIRFQNTGNDTAFSVKILNPIDTFFLKLNTLEFVASSHPVDMRFIYHERNMEFRFDNILLPDSNVNEPASHGFVRYRIQPQDTLALSDSIKNFAAIYFDFNDPVITNTAITEIVLPTGTSSLFHGKGPGVKSFPNPATDVIIFSTSQPRGSRAKIVIYNSIGQPVLRTESTQPQARVDISTLSQGLYMVDVRNAEHVLHGKFVKR